METEEAAGAARRSRAEELARLFVGWPSLTGTPGEAEFASRLADLLAASPVFGEDAVRLVPSHGSPQTASVAALARGRGRRTVILAGHFDVVSVANYGALADLAFDPDALREALVAELRESAATEAEHLALADLASRDFLPGRGMLDMKSGLAAGLAAIERWAGDPLRDGNLLFVATPDEENRSRGMRSLRNALPALARDWQLDILAGINLDASEDNGDGGEGRAVFFGTVGKVSPFVHVVGRGTHAGYPYGGVSAHLIAAEIMRAVEARASLSDERAGERSPPPVCLEARDFREVYDVTTPAEVWMSFNWLTHGRSPADILGQFAGLVESAGSAAIAAQAAEAEGHGAGFDPRRLKVLQLAELVEMAADRTTDFAERHAMLAGSLDALDNPLLISQTIVRQLVREAALDGPAAVVGLSSLWYPHTHAAPERPAGAAFRKTVTEAANAAAARHGATLRTAEFFQGICDMSFLGQRPDAQTSARVAAATPSQALVDRPPEDTLDFPVCNIGPWGRQFHQKLERVHARYAFEALPDILCGVAKDLLRPPPA